MSAPPSRIYGGPSHPADRAVLQLPPSDDVTPPPGAEVPAGQSSQYPCPLPEHNEFRVHRCLTTRSCDDDRTGHISIVACYSLFDTALTSWLMSSSGLDLRNHVRIPVLAETSCQFVAPLSFPEMVSVGIGLARLGQTSVVYRLGLFRVEDGPGRGVLAVARFVQVYVDAITRKPATIPHEIIRALQELA